MLACGWDTFVESWNYNVPHDWTQHLDKLKAEAATMNTRGGAPVTLEIGAEEFQIKPHGGAYTKWILESPDFRIDIRGSNDFALTVRYSAAGLWQHGLKALRERVARMMEAEFQARDDRLSTVSSAHYAFDLYSPAFSKEMEDPAIITNFAAKRSKQNQHWEPRTWFGEGRFQTITIGRKDSLEIQIYDKCREITEASGKTWMFDVWRLNGFEFGDDEKDDIWRVELRWGSEYLKERNVRTYEEIELCRAELITEALVSRRLCVPTGDDARRRRWDVHPMFTACRDRAGAGDMLPIGKRVEGARAVLVERAELQIAGALRSANVLENRGEFDREAVEEFVSRVVARLEDDPEHEKKIQAAAERYRYVDRAR